jgi:hypothetical protein
MDDDDGSQPELELELVSSSRVRKLHESEQCWKEDEPVANALLERLQISREQRPYMNLDEFVTSLARKNCFDDQDHDQNCSVQQMTSTTSVAEGSEEFPRLFGGAEGADEDLQGDIEAVETSLRLATSSSLPAKSIHHSKPAQRRTAILTEIEPDKDAAADQSSTESMEQRSGRPTRNSSSTGGKRERIVSSEESEHSDEEEEDDASSDGYESSKKKPANKKKRAAVPDRPKRKGKKAGSSRSGRPKRLKYLQQENVEELGNQCNRRDGKGWTCPLLAKPGYQLCDHHLDKLRCKPGSRSKYNKSKRKK